MTATSYFPTFVTRVIKLPLAEEITALQERGDAFAVKQRRGTRMHCLYPYRTGSPTPIIHSLFLKAEKILRPYNERPPFR